MAARETWDDEELRSLDPSYSGFTSQAGEPAAEAEAAAAEMHKEVVREVDVREEVEVRKGVEAREEQLVVREQEREPAGVLKSR